MTFAQVESPTSKGNAENQAERSEERRRFL